MFEQINEANAVAPQGWHCILCDGNNPGNPNRDWVRPPGQLSVDLDVEA